MKEKGESEVRGGRLLNAEEVAEALGVKVSWIRWKCHRRELPVIHCGKYVRFSLQDVLEKLRGGQTGEGHR